MIKSPDEGVLLWTEFLRQNQTIPHRLAELLKTPQAFGQLPL